MRSPSRIVAVAAALAVSGGMLVGCGRGGPTAIIGVDNSHDAFSASMIDYFPDTVTVHPGDTVRFRQRWTGEPHSVTFGASFNDALGRIRERLAEPLPPDPEDLPELAVIEALPVMLGRDAGVGAGGQGGAQEFVVNQNGAQPCYLDEGAPPTDPDEACPTRAQPVFTGEHSYYSSGFIPYRGPQGNRFDVELSETIEPGPYHFYCNLHGVGQSGTVEVVPADEPLPSRASVDRATQATITSRYSEPLRDALAAARGGELRIDGIDYEAPFAGAASTAIRPWGGAAHRRHFSHRHGSVDEFVPSVLRVTAGEPARWTFVGRHTISFNVPSYLPVFAVDPDGTVELDRRVHEAVGWSVPSARPAGEPAHVDVGEWDGRGFRSSGLDWRTGDTFSVTFTRPGSYLLACLVHPAMVGKVVVTPS